MTLGAQYVALIASNRIITDVTKKVQKKINVAEFEGNGRSCKTETWIPESEMAGPDSQRDIGNLWHLYTDLAIVAGKGTTSMHIWESAFPFLVSSEECPTT